jgi:antirestriction protein ArdC
VRTETPFVGVNVLLMNLSAQEQGYRSKWWGTEGEWASIGGQVSGAGIEMEGGTLVYNANQVQGLAVEPYRVGNRHGPAPVDYDPAEKVIAASCADIRHRFGKKALYFYPPADYILFPLREQFELGAGGLSGYYDSIFHELMHWTEPRLSWRSSPAICELRAEIGAPFLESQLGLPVFTDLNLLMNHCKYLGTWVKEMKKNPMLIVRITAAASHAVAYLLSRKN